MFVVLLCFFFFKQKTAYEMRISDWSSDVCSSDLRWPTSRARLPDGCWWRACSTSSSRTDRFALPPLTARRPRGGSPRGGRRDLALPAQTRDNQDRKSVV